jgi:hypothetical protein
LAMEQKYLDKLFSIPEEFRYNFSPTAGSTFGYKHTEETRAKKMGENNPNYGNTGANHPFFGKSHTEEARAKMSAARVGRVSNRALKVYVYTLENILVKEFMSKVEAANWLNVSDTTVLNYIKSGKVLEGKYYIRRSTNK